MRNIQFDIGQGDTVLFYEMKTDGIQMQFRNGDYILHACHVNTQQVILLRKTLDDWFPNASNAVNPPPFCINCKHYDGDKEDIYAMSSCRSPVLKRLFDLVTGKEKFQKACMMRNDLSACGPSGKWFDPKCSS